jgi:Na+/melibiose symporter-like transporter
MTASLSALALFARINPYIFIAGVSCFTIFLSLINSCGVNLYLDCGEYQLYKTGKDVRTFTMSMYGVAIKTGFIIATLVTTVVLEASGYSGATNTVANLRTMVMLIGGIPAALCLLYTLLLLVYGITEEKAKEYAAHNHQAAQAAKAAAAS